jgi:hypothetical protein
VAAKTSSLCFIAMPVKSLRRFILPTFLAAVAGTLLVGIGKSIWVFADKSGAAASAVITVGSWDFDSSLPDLKEKGFYIIDASGNIVKAPAINRYNASSKWTAKITTDSDGKEDCAVSCTAYCEPDGTELRVPAYYVDDSFVVHRCTTLGYKTGNSYYKGVPNCVSTVTSLIIPDTYLHMGPYAIWGSGHLWNSITYSKNIVDFGYRSCEGAQTKSFLTSDGKTWPSCLTSIGTYAFNHNNSADASYFSFFQNTDLSGTQVTTIGDHAFYQQDSLKNITFPSTLLSIGISAFDNCSISSVDLTGTGITSVGARAFSSQASTGSLFSVTLPATLTTVGAGAFNNNTGNFTLETVRVPLDHRPSGFSSTNWACYSGADQWSYQTDTTLKIYWNGVLGPQIGL